MSAIKKWCARNWAWLGPVAGAVASVAFAMGILIWASSSRDELGDNDIIADWNRTISKLGIDPVFPPEEDIYVGDIFAIVTADRLEVPNKAGTSATLSASNPLLNRSVKIDHVDMTKTLKEYYAQLPVFSSTTARPTADRDIWPQVTDSNLFSSSEHKSLSIAAFPAFTIKTTGSTAGNLLMPGIGRLHFAKDRNESEELEIVFAETYGVPTVIAAAILADYCADPYSQSACVEDSVRDHLSFLMGQPVKELLPDKKTYRFEVELHLVYRAYLTRAINRRRGNQLTREATSERPQDQQSSGADASGKIQSEQETSMDRAFQRPVVFGYRAVKKSFKGVREDSK